MDAVGVALLLVPASAEAELEAAVADDVERRGHVGQNRRVAVHHPVDHATDADTGGGLGQRRERDPSLHTRPGGVGNVDRIEVVEVPGRFEQLDPVGGPPDVEHVAPGGVLRRGLDPELHAPTLRNRGSLRCARCQLLR